MRDSIVRSKKNGKQPGYLNRPADSGTLFLSRWPQRRSNDPCCQPDILMNDKDTVSAVPATTKRLADGPQALVLPTWLGSLSRDERHVALTIEDKRSATP